MRFSRRRGRGKHHRGAQPRRGLEPEAGDATPYEPSESTPYEPPESTPATAEGSGLGHWLETFADLSRSRPEDASSETEPTLAPSNDVDAVVDEADTDEPASRPADPLPTSTAPTAPAPAPATDEPRPIESTQAGEQFAPVDDTLLPRARRRRR